MDDQIARDIVRELIRLLKSHAVDIPWQALDSLLLRMEMLEMDEGDYDAS